MLCSSSFAAGCEPAAAASPATSASRKTCCSHRERRTCQPKTRRAPPVGNSSLSDTMSEALTHSWFREDAPGKSSLTASPGSDSVKPRSPQKAQCRLVFNVLLHIQSHCALAFVTASFPRIFRYNVGGVSVYLKLENAFHKENIQRCDRRAQSTVMPVKARFLRTQLKAPRPPT